LKKIDAIDREILQALHADPQITNKRLAGLTGVSEPTVASRIDSLTQRNVMRVSMQRNLLSTEFPTLGMLDVSVEDTHFDQLLGRLKAMPNLLSITVFADAPSVHVLLTARDAAHLQDLVDDQVAGLPGIREVAVTVCIGSFYLAPGIAVL
jgi:DNA-binding Lrp family transcriptional regulator